MTRIELTVATLVEPLALAGGIATFLTLALCAAAPPANPHRTRDRGSIEAGPLALEATLSRSKLQKGEEETVLLHLRLRGASARETLPIDVALVLDVAETMAENDNLALMSRACLEVSRQLGPDDRITVVSFSDEARTVLAPGVADMGPLVAGKGRNVSGGLDRAAAELRRSSRPGAVRRILLVTGGRPDRGVTDRGELRALVARLAAEGISTSTLGLGLDYDASLLKALSDAGGGSYHHVEEAERLAGIYAAELRALHGLVARDVRLTLTPSPGVAIDVVEWAASEDARGTSVLVGDFEGDRSAKVVARLRVPAGSVPADLVSVTLEARDARSHAALTREPVLLGVHFTDDPREVQASAAHGLERDLEDAQVVLDLRRAEECARRRDEAGARAALASIRQIRPTLEYRAADGKVERKTVDALEAELLWFATRGGDEKGLLSTFVDNARESVASLLPIQARKHGNEASAIGALKTITTSESMFREGDKERDGNLDYGNLDELAKTGLVDSVLGSGVKQGYRFSVHASPKTPGFLWYATAFPESPGKTGERYFYTNQSGVIFYSTSPFEVDPETGQVKPNRWDMRAEKFVESYVIPTGK